MAPARWKLILSKDAGVDGMVFENAICDGFSY